MIDRFSMIDRVVQTRVVQRLRAAARDAATSELSVLRQQRGRARQIRTAIDDLLHVAEDRLALPKIGSNVFPKPPGTRWSWRPPQWRGPVMPRGIAGIENAATLGAGLKVFHDCKVSELTLRQIRNCREEDLAAYGVTLDVLGFDGSFLSVVVDLPPEASDGLRRRDIIRLHGLIDAERPATVFARLNIKCGPNTAQLVEEISVSETNVTADFDLAYAELNENRIDSMWLDLILENPAMNQMRIRDLTFCRYPRAEV